MTSWKLAVNPLNKLELVCVYMCMHACAHWPSAALISWIDAKDVQVLLALLSLSAQEAVSVLMQVVHQVSIKTVLGNDVDRTWEKGVGGGGVYISATDLPTHSQVLMNTEHFCARVCVYMCIQFLYSYVVFVYLIWCMHRAGWQCWGAGPGESWSSALTSVLVSHWSEPLLRDQSKINQPMKHISAA